MSIRASVFIATSVDGFIATPDGGIDWWTEAAAKLPAGEDCGYGAFMASVDALVMGRHTYEQVLTFDPWPYGEKPVTVLSSGPIDVPARLAQTVQASSETPAMLLQRLVRTGVSHVYVDGGNAIQRFLAEGLIDQMTITTIPILLGEGRPLFSAVSGRHKLRLIGSMAYEFGFVQSTYAVEADA